MKKYKVIVAFLDREDGLKKKSSGVILSLTDERAEVLLSRGFIEEVKEDKKKGDMNVKKNL